MSIFLALCVLAAAGWLVASVANRNSSDDPGDSVAAYTRAMAALDPTGHARAVAPRRVQARPATARARRPGAPRRPRPVAAHRRVGSR